MKAKRMIGAALAVCLALSAPLGSWAQAEGDTAREVLNALAIMTYDETGSFQGSSTLTRAQLAKIVVMSSALRGSVGESTSVSPFYDVPYTHWAAPYIAMARDNAMMRGYTDGSFRPDQAVLYAEAVQAVMNLLGYTTADYTGGYPSGTLSKARSLGLLDGVSGQQGSAITRDGMAQLLYNALCTDVKGGESLAQTLGYTPTDGQLSLGDVLDDTAKGPVTLTPSTTLASLGLSQPLVYRDGSLAGESDLAAWDVLYYSTASNTVWAYSDKKSGTLEAISPNKQNPTSITVSGVTYSLSTAAAKSAVGLDGLETGDIVTVLLDRDGGAADVCSASSVYDQQLGVVTQAGTKTLSGTSTYYVTLLLTDGSTLDVACQSDRSSLVGRAVRLSYGSGGASISTASSATLVGEVDASARTIGSKALSDDVTILDLAESGTCVSVSLSRIDGLSLSSGSVLLATTDDDGKIDAMILNDVTGDAHSYGYVLYSSQDEDDKASPSYRIDIGGTVAQVSGGNTWYNVYSGAACITKDADGSISSMRNLTRLSKSIALATPAQVLTTDGQSYALSGDVAVYDASGTQIRYAGIDELMEQEGAVLEAYYDKLPSDGGRIRVIVYR